MSAFSGCGKRGLLCIAVPGLPAAEASFVAERGLEGTGLIVVAPGSVAPWHVRSSQIRD